MKQKNPTNFLFYLLKRLLKKIFTEITVLVVIFQNLTKE